MAAPVGNRNAAKARDWTDALKWALSNYQARGIKKGQALQKLALKVIEQGLAGNPQAITEIANRLDGKPVQPMELDATLRPCDVSAEPLSERDWFETYGSTARPNA
jgi:hypothetical protein